MTHIRGVLWSVSSQRLQFKPYGYELRFDGYDNAPQIIVEFDIPTDTVLEEGSGDKDNFESPYIVVDLDGLNAILEVTADSLDKLDADYKKKIQGG